jgi:hypothetical protein
MYLLKSSKKKSLLGGATAAFFLNAKGGNPEANAVIHCNSESAVVRLHVIKTPMLPRLWVTKLRLTHY